MSNFIIKEMYPIVTKNLKKPEVFKDLRSKILKFFDENTMALHSNGPYEKLSFFDQKQNEFAQILGFDRNEIRAIIKKITFIDKSWVALTNDFGYILICLLIFFKKNKKKDDFELTNLFFGVYIYSIYLSKYFQFVQKETMEYTIANLSNKHDLKTFGTIYKTVVDKMRGIEDKYGDNLDSSDDRELVDYFMNVNSRINQWLKGLMIEYKANKDSGRYFNSETDKYGDDDYKETTNISLEIERITNIAANKFFSSEISLDIISISSKLTEVSRDTLYNTMHNIRKDAEIADIKAVIKSILIIYAVDAKGDLSAIKSEAFINQSLLIYSASNTVSKETLLIKDILDKYMKKYNHKYVLTNREATKIMWRKAMFLYLAISIQYFN